MVSALVLVQVSGFKLVCLALAILHLTNPQGPC